MCNLTRYKFKNICLDKGFIRGPFGSALKKSLFVPKSEDTYKVYEQCVPLEQDKSKGNYYITGDYFRKSLSRFEVKHNDFLVSCSGVNYGAIYHLKEPFEQGVINQALLIIRVNDKIVDYYYFKYLFKIVLSRAITTGTGDSTIPNFPSIDVIKDIDVYLPTIDVQQKIGAILNCIDEKIINNIHVSDYLQHMAKTLYDYWFVQFDFPDENGKPYRTSGGAMKWNEQLKREIPKEWGVGNLYNIADFINGLACQKFRPKDGENALPVIKIKEMHDGITAETEQVSENIPTKHKIYDGDILFSWSATLEVMYWYGGIGGLNQHIFKVNPKSYFPKEYVYEQLSSYIVNFVKLAEARKTTMGHITTDHLEQGKIPLPPESLLNQFTEKIRPIHQKIGQTKQENCVLTKLRDWLLPMLMNGQARVE